MKDKKHFRFKHMRNGAVVETHGLSFFSALSALGITANEAYWTEIKSRVKAVAVVTISGQWPTEIHQSLRADPNTDLTGRSNIQAREANSSWRE